MTKILLVEDQDDNRAIYRMMLEHLGYSVIEACDGEEAINAALMELPALILMDISIPKINGWDATRMLKADPITAHIPVVALTAHALPGDEEMCRAAGCDEYIAKPAEPRLVAKVVNTLIGPSIEMPR